MSQNLKTKERTGDVAKCEGCGLLSPRNCKKKKIRYGCRQILRQSKLEGYRKSGMVFQRKKILFPMMRNQRMTIGKQNPTWILKLALFTCLFII